MELNGWTSPQMLRHYGASAPQRTFYFGDLLVAVTRLSPEYWAVHPGQAGPPSPDI